MLDDGARGDESAVCRLVCYPELALKFSSMREIRRASAPLRHFTVPRAQFSNGLSGESG